MGKVVTITKQCDEIETELNARMMGTVREIVLTKYEDTLLVTLDMGGVFLNHNKYVAEHTYYAADHNPTLNAWEAGYWPKDNLVKIYVDQDDPGYFSVNNEVFTAHQIPQQTESNLSRDEQIKQLITVAYRLGLSEATKLVEDVLKLNIVTTAR